MAPSQQGFICSLTSKADKQTSTVAYRDAPNDRPPLFFCGQPTTCAITPNGGSHVEPPAHSLVAGFVQDLSITCTACHGRPPTFHALGTMHLG